MSSSGFFRQKNKDVNLHVLSFLTETKDQVNLRLVSKYLNSLIDDISQLNLDFEFPHLTQAKGFLGYFKTLKTEYAHQPRLTAPERRLRSMIKLDNLTEFKKTIQTLEDLLLEKCGETLLVYAQKNNAEKILAYIYSLAEADSEENNYLIFWAIACYQNEEFEQFFTGKNMDLVCYSKKLRTALSLIFITTEMNFFHIAALSDNHKVMRFLIANHPQMPTLIKAYIDISFNPLILAAIRGSVETLNLLLDVRVNNSLVFRTIGRALTAAVDNDQTATASVLIKNEAEITVSDICTAIDHKNIELVKLLLQAKQTEFSNSDVIQFHILNKAISVGNKAIFNYLFSITDHETKKKYMPEWLDIAINLKRETIRDLLVKNMLASHHTGFEIEMKR